MLRFPLLRETGTRMSHDWSWHRSIPFDSIDATLTRRVEKWKFFFNVSFLFFSSFPSNDLKNSTFVEDVGLNWPNGTISLSALRSISRLEPRVSIRGVVGAEYFSRTRWKRMSASRGKSADARALTYRVAIARVRSPAEVRRKEILSRLGCSIAIRTRWTKPLLSENERSRSFDSFALLLIVRNRQSTQ